MQRLPVSAASTRIKARDDWETSSDPRGPKWSGGTACAASKPLASCDGNEYDVKLAGRARASLAPTNTSRAAYAAFGGTRNAIRSPNCADPRARRARTLWLPAGPLGVPRRTPVVGTAQGQGRSRSEKEPGRGRPFVPRGNRGLQRQVTPALSPARAIRFRSPPTDAAWFTVHRYAPARRSPSAPGS
jgi:hypothetical protein